MNEENSVSLKVYLMEGDAIVEVRRFEIDQAVITNYDYVRERLQVVIPKLRENVYKLLWQDSDGDEVTISSDEELMIALTELKTNICKFIVRLPSETPETDTARGFGFMFPNLFEMIGTTSMYESFCPLFAELKTDVNCDSCSQLITGLRYKCLECEHYNQCSECEYRDFHPDHVMLRIGKDPAVGGLLPKCMNILKSHLMRGGRCAGANMGSFCRDRMSRHAKDGDKEKCGKGHHGRKFRKHGRHHSPGKHHSPGRHNSPGRQQSPGRHHSPSKTPPTHEEPMAECPFGNGQIGNLGSLVNAFLGMQGNLSQKPKECPKQTPKASKSDEPKDIFVDGPPMSATEDLKMHDEPSVASPSTSNADKDSNLNSALAMLAEMGFTDENKWLTRLLEHFHGDIAKTLDHLTLGK